MQEPPRILNAGLPPGFDAGASGLGESPPAVLGFRAYAGLLSFGALALLVFGLTEVVKAARVGKGSSDEVIVGVLCAAIGMLLTVIHLLAVVCPRRPWMHTYGIVLLVLGSVGGSCCLPLTVTLLVYWLKPSVKAWFQPAEGPAEGGPAEGSARPPGAW